MKKQIIMPFFIMSITSILITPGYAGWKPSVEDEPAESKLLLNTQAEEVVKNFKIHYPHLTVYFEKAYGYAVFPTITKGGVGIRCCTRFVEQCGIEIPPINWLELLRLTTLSSAVPLC